MHSLNGYVKIHRKLLQWGWYQDNVVKGVFFHLLLTAAFRDSQWMGRTIKKGQVIVSMKKMAEELGFTRQQVRTAINKLKSTNEITTEATNRYTIVTVVNWEEYQSANENATNKPTSNRTIKQPTSNQQITNKQPHRKNDKNVNNVKKDKKYTPAGEFVPSGRFEESGEEYVEIDGKKYNRRGQELNSKGYPILG